MGIIFLPKKGKGQEVLEKQSYLSLGCLKTPLFMKSKKICILRRAAQEIQRP